MDFFTSDQHFGHKNIIQYTGRPFNSVAEMNLAMIERYNSVVSEEDNVFFLGDFAFYPIEKQKEILSSLKGKKYLFLGNHDRKKKVMLDIGFLEVYETSDMILGGQKFRLSHYPFKSDHDPYKIRFEDRRPSKEGCEWLLCGHIHEKWKVLENQINCGVDVWDFFPVPLDKILSIVNLQV